eukprot:scaffold44607_cov18-Prasinocladus_malaysianus.AAC.1
MALTAMVMVVKIFFFRTAPSVQCMGGLGLEKLPSWSVQGRLVISGSPHFDAEIRRQKAAADSGRATAETVGTLSATTQRSRGCYLVSEVSKLTGGMMPSEKTQPDELDL